MDPPINALLVAVLSALAWVAYEHPVEYRATIFFFGQCVCGVAVLVLGGYLVGAAQTQSVALIAATEADIMASMPPCGTPPTPRNCHGGRLGYPAS